MTRAVVWIDHKEARIFHVHPEAADETTVLSPQHHIHRHPKGRGEAREHPDDAHGSSTRWHETLDGVDALLIVGPSSAKLEFFKFVHEHHRPLESKVVGVESADHPTEGEIVARARSYFKASDRMGSPTSVKIEPEEAHSSIEGADVMVSREGAVPPERAEMTMTDESVMPMPPRPLTVKAFGITDKGKVRTTNEDQFLIAELTKAMRVWQTSLPEPKVQVGEERAHLFLVADGMGGHRAGERASALAVVAIEQFTLNTFKWFFGSDGTEAQKVLAQFQSALSQADARILEEAAEHPELSGMGTTVTMAFHLGTQLCVVHVGDSRAYLYRDGELHQLTQDHTLMADMVRERSASARPGRRAPSPPRHHERRRRPGARSQRRSSRVRSSGWRSLTALFGRIDGDGDERGDRGHARRGARTRELPRRSCSRRQMMAGPATTSRC